MTPEEIVKSLRSDNGIRAFLAAGESADIIESQQKQIEDLQKQLDAARNDIKQYARVKELCISNESECAMDKSDNWCERCPAWEYKGKGANK